VIAALRQGLHAVARNWGLVLLLLLVNVVLAGVLAAPLAADLEKDLRNKDAAGGMMYGFDYGWWSEWHDRQQGAGASFGPEVFGIGFAFRNLDLLLKGALPGALFARAEENGEPVLPPLILALGGLYVLVQVFLTGGVLGVLRAPEGGWTVRALMHGSGFYFGRMLRLALVSLAALWVLFVLYFPLAGWIDALARDAVSERTAMAWSIGRHAALLLAILFLNMVNGYAKVMIVVEERASAILAWVSAFSFCLRRLARAGGLYALVAAAAVLLLLVWRLLDGAWTTTGYVTQLFTLLLFQLFLFARLFLRLGLLGGQLALYRYARPE
jgi:hypothetical protein